MARIITIGEPLVQLVAMHKGPLESMDRFEKTASGVELCFAIGMTRLGYEVNYVTKLGKDPLGKYLYNFMNEHNINTDYVEFVNKYPTGIMIRNRGEDSIPEISYHRHGTASSTLTKEYIKRIDWHGVNHLHVSGIPLSISSHMREAVMEMIYQAHQHDVTVGFDPNIRPALWYDEEEMLKVINGVSLLCDIIFPEYEEAVKLLGLTDMDKIADFYLNAGVKTVMIKSHDKGIYVKNKKVCFTADSYNREDTVDVFGMGEGFAVGVTSAILEGRNLVQAVERGRLVASSVGEYYNSFDGMPSREGLIKLVNKLYHMSVEDFLAKNLLVPERKITEEIAADMNLHAHEQLDPSRKYKGKAHGQHEDQDLEESLEELEENLFIDEQAVNKPHITSENIDVDKMDNDTLLLECEEKVQKIGKKRARKSVDKTQSSKVRKVIPKDAAKE